MVRSLLLIGLLATSASAQSVQLKYFSQPDEETRLFNASACNGVVQVTWTTTLAPPLGACSELKLWSTELECGETPAATDVRYTSVSVAQLAALMGTFDVPLDGLPGFKYSDAGTLCGAVGVEKPHRICGSVTVYSGGVGVACTVQSASSLSLIYDTKPPNPPAINEVVAQDSALQLKFSASADTTVVHIYARAQGTSMFKEVAKLATSVGSLVRITNLTNGTTYDVQARAEDGAGNLSEPSELASATPRLTKGFWGRYKDAGGDEKGGCEAVHGVPLLLAGGLWLLRRKRN